MIVRDEERHLDACLASLDGLVDEIVVVDTGSRDRSREIAAARGARVFEYRWRDDFSAARNEALDRAAGDWILYIDADERVRPYGRAALLRDLANPELCAATVRFYPQTGFTAYHEHRLFRHRADIRFRGAMHETIIPDLDRLGAPRGASDLTIDHIGYDSGRAAKAGRDLLLLEKELQIDPDRVFLWWHLGVLYRDTGNPDKAEAAWRRGVEIARRFPGQRPEDALCFIELAKRGNEEALLAEALARFPGNLLLQWLHARELAGSGRHLEAIAVFARLGEIDPDTLTGDVAYDRRILGAAAFAEAGHCAFLEGNYTDSESWYGHAESREPDNLEYRVKRRFAASRGRTVLGSAQPPASRR